MKKKKVNKASALKKIRKARAVKESEQELVDRKIGQQATRGNFRLTKNLTQDQDFVRVQVMDRFAIVEKGEVAIKEFKTAEKAELHAAKVNKQLERKYFEELPNAVGALLPRFVYVSCFDSLVDVVPDSGSVVGDKELVALASITEWDDVVLEQIQNALFYHYVDKGNAIGASFDFYPRIDEPSGVWEFVSTHHVRPYGKDCLVFYLGCKWEDEDGLEVCIQKERVRCCENAWFGGLEGYLKQPYASYRKKIDKFVSGWQPPTCFD